MKSIRGTWGCLALALAAMGGCTDSGSRADAPTLLGQQRSAVAVGAPELVRDLRPAASKNPPSDPGSFAVMGGTVFFNAGDTLHGRELWASDETGGTRLVRDILPGGRDSHPGGFAAVGELIIFSAVEEDGTTRQLWRSDGTAEGTRRITNMAGGFQVWEQLVVGETLFLSVVDGAGDVELWKSDGTSEGTLRVKDLWPGGSSSPVLMQDVGGTLYFAANDGVTGFELWKSDGTPQGTVQVMDITPGAASTFLGRELVVMGGTLYFTAAHPTENGVELWKTDGTVEGTRRVKDIWPGPEGSALMYLTVLGDVLYFIADDGVWGRELWRSDGTEEGTRRVKDILPGSSASEPYGFHVVDGVLYFSARTWDFGRELWRSDGTEAGTWRVTDIEPGERDSLRSTPVRAGSRLYFFGIRSSGGYQLWRYDTKTGDTAQLHSYSPVVWYGTPPWDTASAGDTLYFFADDGRGVEPWKTDGTPEGTVLLEDIHTDNGHSAPRNLVDLGGTVLFSVSGAGSDALWKSDGTAAGTSLLRDGFAALWSSHEVVGGVVFFPARTAEAGVELWRSDGTPAGTWLVKDINPGPTGSDIQLLGQAGGKLLFSAWSGGFRLWASDGT
ncbi:ELWxxDGT repeat protein, partial [Archangium sp.]|uniref:ELWxxDGT repeat protein n=1 Tax=Archangium sp. TaxID=1872627 RepID=UPI002ED8C560